MRTTILFSTLTIGSVFVAGPLRAQAAIEGVVQLPERVSQRILIQRYAAGDDAGLAPTDPPIAVVYLEGDFQSAPTTAQKAVSQMAQKNITFAPDLLPIQVGTAIDFPNLDDTYHNVFSYSKTKRFDLGRYRKNEKPGTVVFDKPGVVAVHCEIHDRMRGTILVLETPYFQKSDAAGNYRLEHLPAGHFTLKAWISEKDIREHPVELKSGTTLHVDFPGK